MKNLQKYFWAVIDYGPPVITLIFGSVVILEAQRRSVPIEQMLNWVLTILVLLATTQLIDRLRRLRSIESRLSEISWFLQKENRQ